MQSNPITIPQTRRQRVVTRSGEVLERAYVFLPAESWEALKRLCAITGRSGSQTIESLIEIAARGKLKDKNEQPANTSK